MAIATAVETRRTPSGAHRLTLCWGGHLVELLVYGGAPGVRGFGVWRIGDRVAGLVMSAEA